MKISFFGKHNNSKNIEALRQQATGTAKEFIGLCLTSRAALRGELDDSVIMSFNKVLLQYIDSRDFNNDFGKNYDQALTRYGSVEITMYSLIVSMLLHGPQNETSKEMLEQANARLKSLKDIK